MLLHGANRGHNRRLMPYFFKYMYLTGFGHIKTKIITLFREAWSHIKLNLIFTCAKMNDSIMLMIHEQKKIIKNKNIIMIWIREKQTAAPNILVSLKFTTKSYAQFFHRLRNS